MGLTRTHGQINNDGHNIEVQIDTAAQDSGIKMESEEIENDKGNYNKGLLNTREITKEMITNYFVC
jgi:hypothetical protein